MTPADQAEERIEKSIAMLKRIAGRSLWEEMAACLIVGGVTAVFGFVLGLLVGQK